MPTINESFNTADSTTLGPGLSWTETSGDLEVASGGCEAVDASGGFAAADDAIGADEVFASISVKTAPSSGSNLAVGIRCTTANQSGLYFLANGNSASAYRIFSRSSGGSWTQVGDTTTGTLPSTPFTMEIRCSGTTITAYVNGELKVTATSSDFASQDKAGIHASNTFAGSIESFAAGTIVAEDLPALIKQTKPGFLQGYFKCDETSGTDVLDYSGNEKDLSLTGTPATDYNLNQAGQVDAAIEFLGAAGYASRTDSLVGATAGDFTLFGLVNGAAQDNKRLISLGSSSSGNPFICIGTPVSGTAARAVYRDNTGGTQRDISGGVLLDGSWHSVALRRNSNTFSLWVDGVSVASEVVALTTISLDRTAIGALLRSTASNFGDALLQHVAFWSEDLADAEIEALHAMAFGLTVTNTRIVQRSGDSGSLPVSGTYSDETTAKIQARVLLSSDDSSVVDWTDVDTSPSGDVWSGTISVPTGGPYYVQARALDSGDSELGTATGASTFVVGDVFLMFGQSNMAGRATNDQTYTGDAVAWLARESGDIDETLNDSISDNSTDGSWVPLFANLIDAHLSGEVPLVFIVSAEGTTGLTTPDADWLPPSGTNYSAMATRVSALDPTGIAAAVWLQGERDAANSISAATYEANEKTLATAIASLPGAPPLISTLIGHNTSLVSATQLDPIRLAKIANWADGSTKPGANPIDINLSDESGDGLHFKTNTELAILAGRTWIGLQSAVYSGGNPRGPKLVRAEAVGSTVELTFDRDLDTGDTSYTAGAFTVDNDDSTARSVSGVARSGNRKVIVTCDGAVDGTAPTVTFASGNTAAGATIPKTAVIALPETINSVASVALPAEPFVAVEMPYSVAAVNSGGALAQSLTRALTSGLAGSLS